MVSFQAGRFYHVAARKSGGDLSLFIDGVEVESASTACTGPTLANTGTTLIGAQDPVTATTASRPLDGLIDEMQVFNRALTTDEIGAIFNAGTAGAAGPTRFEIGFPTSTEDGDYELSIGPGITDTAGNPMPSAYQATFSIDQTGPAIVASSPVGDVITPVSQVAVTFDTPINTVSFQTGDVTLTGPNGAVAINSVTFLNTTDFRINFPAQTGPGDYTVTVGPGIADVVGNAMDQDRDGINGEPQDDGFTATFTLRLPDLTITALGFPTTIDDGDAVTLTTTVSNLGNAGTPGGFHVRFSIDGNTIGDVELAGGLGPTATRTVSVSWIAVPGQHIFGVAADVFGLVAESSESNNSLAQQLPTVLDVTPPIVTSMSPRDGSRHRGFVTVTAFAADNVGVTNYVFEYSTDTLVWTQIASGPVRTGTWDTKQVGDRQYRVRVTVDDAAGNTASLTYTYTVDNTPPGAPVGIKASSEELSVLLSWDLSPEPVVAYYRVYRRPTSSAQFTLVQDRLGSPQYRDHDVLPDVDLVYAVHAVDDLGNASAMSQEVEARPQGDITPPAIQSFLPPDGSRFNLVPRLQASAVDNFSRVLTYTFEYATDTIAWTLIGANTAGWVDWDTRPLADGPYSVRLTVTDETGNRASLTLTHTVDNSPPAVPVVSAEPRELAVFISWGASPDSDVRRHLVFRASAPGGPYGNIATVSGLSYIDTDVIRGVIYYYVVAARDDLGNRSDISNEVAAGSLPDSTAPTVVGVSPANGSDVVGTVTIDADARDNVGVTRYVFEYSGDDGQTWGLIADTIANSTPWDSAAVEDGEWTLRVTAVDAANNSSTLAVSYRVLNTPLPAPERILVEAGQRVLTVAWAPVNDSTVQAYRVFRSADAGAFQQLSEVTATVFTDRSVSPDLAYEYQVAALDRFGRLGDATTTAAFVPLQQTTTPAILTVTPPTSSTFGDSLTVSVIADDEIRITEFVLERAVSSTATTTTWEEIGRAAALPAGGKRWRASITWDTSALPDAGYTVRIRAINVGGLEDAREAFYVLDRTPPSAPSDPVVADPRAGDSLELSWVPPPESDVAGYRVYRSETQGGPYQLVATVGNVTQHSDAGLSRGVIYYYVIKAIDTAGNEGAASNEASGVPTAQADLALLGLTTNPANPPKGSPSPVTVRVLNHGPASASASVRFVLVDGAQRTIIGTTVVNLAPGGEKVAQVTWTPSVEGPKTLEAELADLSVVDPDNTNDRQATVLRVNLPPSAPELSAVTTGWGEETVYDATGAADADGAVTRFAWAFGDGETSNVARTNHRYANVGVFDASLTVTDNDGAKDVVNFTVTVEETRPDLIIESLTWSPLEPKEGDLVNITAVVKNVGAGPTTKGFFGTHYIDGLYGGYLRINQLLAPGETLELSFSWLAEPGIHVVRVEADDIQDNVPETDETNNSSQSAMTAAQVFFPDLVVVGISVSPPGPDLSSEESIIVQATIRNQGQATAEDFLNSLFLDGQFHSKKRIPILEPGTEKTVSYTIAPSAGYESIEVMADDVAGRVLESNEANNSASLAMPQYTLAFPNLKVGAIDVRPKDPIPPDGSTITVLPEIINDSAVEILQSFSVSLYVDGQPVDEETVPPLAAGQSASPSLRWKPRPGIHLIEVRVDPDNAVAESSEDDNSGIAKTEELKIFYADLTISGASVSPIQPTFGEFVLAQVQVSNLTLVSALNPPRLSFLVDGRQVYAVNLPPIGGKSSILVPVGWTADRAGAHTLEFVIDSSNSVLEEDETNNTFSLEMFIRDSFVMNARFNGLDPVKEKKQTGLPLVVVNDAPVTIGARVNMASTPGTPLTADQGVEARATVSGPEGVVIDNQLMGFNAEDGVFELPPIDLLQHQGGAYFVSVSADDGIFSGATSFNFLVVEKFEMTITTDKQVYDRGDEIEIRGNVRTILGEPVADTEMLIAVGKGSFPGDDLRQFVTRALLGNSSEVQIFHITTDAQGRYTYDWSPQWSQAGKFTINAMLASPSRLGLTSAKTAVFIPGLTLRPSKVLFGAAKNTQDFLDLQVVNLSGIPLEQVTVVFTDLNSTETIKATFDGSNVPSTLGAGSAPVTISLDIAENAPDEAFYTVHVQGVEPTTGAVVKATATIEVQLRAAVPFLVFSPNEVRVALNPEKSDIRTVTVVNKGLGTMRDIRTIQPGILPWVTLGAPPKTELKPGESMELTLTFNAPPDITLGQYIDRVGVTNGSAAYVGLFVEITAADRGSVAFVSQRYRRDRPQRQYPARGAGTQGRQVRDRRPDHLLPQFPHQDGQRGDSNSRGRRGRQIQLLGDRPFAQQGQGGGQRPAFRRR